ncbi:MULTISPECIES: hypothetical protein [Enterococcus]|uniref:hypothetical protein n=1 Tax=Enterococcus TaxID=1350 RepID=UPI0010F8EFEA|nr:MULTISPECIES: hypothetical protein [Enterococcus]KAF1301741.1 hypothetical protein BAU16_07565 [Enterococcus sp. JM9B]
MTMNYLNYEFHLFYKKKKILGILGLILALGFFMGTLYLSNFHPVEPIDQARLQISETDVNHKDKQKTLENYLRLSVEYYDGSLTALQFPEKYFTFHNYYGQSDAAYQFSYNYILYNGLIKNSNNLSTNVIEETTAAQFMLPSLEFSLPLLLILFCFGCSDIVLKDRRNASIAFGLPVSNLKKLLTKTVMGISFSICIFLLFFLVVYITVGIQNGFGSLSIENPIYKGVLTKSNFETLIRANITPEVFSLLPIWKILLEVFIMYLLLSSVFLVIIFTVTNFISSQVVVLSILCPIPVLSYLPQERFSGIYNKWLAYLPWNYLKIVPVLTGKIQQWVGGDNITVLRGVKLYLILLFVFGLVSFLFRNRLSRYNN